VTRHYPTVVNLVTCARCGSLIAAHRDDRGRWVGCPDGDLVEPRPCAYQGCDAVEIVDVSLWLCAEHVTSKTLGRAWKPHR
jgi:hypothetical protein